RPAERPEGLMMAAVLAGGPTAAVTGRAGAAAWGFGAPPAVIEVVRSCGASRDMPGITPHEMTRARIHRSLLKPHERMRLGPLPVTSPDHVLASLTPQVSGRELRQYFLEAGRAGFLTPDCLA